jgi:hypothetical protein
MQQKIRDRIAPAAVSFVWIEEGGHIRRKAWAASISPSS